MCPPNPSPSRARFFSIVFGIYALLLNAAQPVTLEDLQNDPKLTPKSFAKHFADFAYRENSEVQDPEVFLISKSGDCDDFAILADMVLRPKGYETRLMAVRMPGLIAHVVCYVTPEKGYLDYNNRAYLVKIERSGPSLRDVAGKVAKSFSANWTSASEFTYVGNSMKRLVATVVKTDAAPPALQTVPVIKIDF